MAKCKNVNFAYKLDNFELVLMWYVELEQVEEINFWSELRFGEDLMD